MSLIVVTMRRGESVAWNLDNLQFAAQGCHTQTRPVITTVGESLTQILAQCLHNLHNVISVHI